MKKIFLGVFGFFAAAMLTAADAVYLKADATGTGDGSS